MSFWKVHILRRASVEPVFGLWMQEELRHYGYDVGPGTLYPVLKRMERRGWLRCKVDPHGGIRARREYVLTTRGREVLDLVDKYLPQLGRAAGTAMEGRRKRQPHR